MLSFAAALAKIHKKFIDTFEKDAGAAPDGTEDPAQPLQDADKAGAGSASTPARRSPSEAARASPRIAARPPLGRGVA